jgi:hypothetical protein
VAVEVSAVHSALRGGRVRAAGHGGQHGRGSLRVRPLRQHCAGLLCPTTWPPTWPCGCRYGPTSGQRPASGTWS